MDITSLFGLGRIPKGAGTVASLVSLPVLYFAKVMLGWYYYTLILFILLPFAIKCCIEAYAAHGDAKHIVLDEVVGMAIVFVFSGKLSLFKAILGFSLFRILDIFKPWPVSYWQKDASPISIVADDILAGLLAGFFTNMF